MTVLIVENTPDKVRGLLKRWFIEPKPNVFVGTINKRTREKILQYILKYSPPDLAILAVFDDANSQGFSIRRFHDTSRIECSITGHYLIAVPPGAEVITDEDTVLLGQQESDKDEYTTVRPVRNEPDPTEIARILEILKPCLVFYTVKK